MPAGAFLTDSGGTYVFVADGNTAIKRNVQIGQRNINVVEILSGLIAGERVVTSSYAGFTDKERLNISN